jgi:hypothetical protein
MGRKSPGYYRDYTFNNIFSWLPGLYWRYITTDLPEPGYAADKTENILLAINNEDYSAFSRDLITR